MGWGKVSARAVFCAQGHGHIILGGWEHTGTTVHGHTGHTISRNLEIRVDNACAHVPHRHTLGRPSRAERAAPSPQPALWATVGHRKPQHEAAWSHLWPDRGFEWPPHRSLCPVTAGLAAISQTTAPKVNILMPSAAESMGSVEVGVLRAHWGPQWEIGWQDRGRQPPGGACVTGQAR